MHKKSMYLETTFSIFGPNQKICKLRTPQVRASRGLAVLTRTVVSASKILNLQTSRKTYCYSGKIVLCPAVLAPGLQRLEGISTRDDFSLRKISNFLKGFYYCGANI